MLKFSILLFYKHFLAVDDVDAGFGDAVVLHAIQVKDALYSIVGGRELLVEDVDAACGQLRLNSGKN